MKKFNIQDFNNDVNNSGDLYAKFNTWLDYRAVITEFISKHLVSDSNIMVFGAGECNDIDLTYISNTFSNITLSDVDIQSMTAGIKRQSVSKDKITMLQLEYTGLAGSGFFQNLEHMTAKSTMYTDIIDYITDEIKCITPPKLPDDIMGKYKTILSCPVYTQLIYTQIEVLIKILRQFNLYSEVELGAMDSAARNAMTRIITNYNDLMLKSLSETGQLFIVTDIIEIPTDSPSLAIIENYSQMKNIDVEQLEYFIDEYGLPFSKLGLKDLDTKLKNKNSTYAMWPFDEYKHYLCKITEYQK